jgi:hypothetical protein
MRDALTVSDPGVRFAPAAVLAGVAELADARDLKSLGLTRPVPVRFRSPAPINPYACLFLP